MLKRILQCLAVCAAAAPIAAVWATDRCPPLPVEDNICECKVQNYGNSPDSNVTITLYDFAGNVTNQCGPGTIDAGHNVFCNALYGIDNCGCEVTGEAGASRTSLSVYDLNNGANANASVSCK